MDKSKRSKNDQKKCQETALKNNLLNCSKSKNIIKTKSKRKRSKSTPNQSKPNSLQKKVILICLNIIKTNVTFCFKFKVI